MLQSPTMAASCPDCGADIQHAQTREGEHVPLERWTSPDGEHRWTIVTFGAPGKPHIIEPVTNAMAEGYPDHREDCPAHQNGLRGVHVH